MEDLKTDIGTRLRKIRIRHEYTQDNVSEMLGVSQKHYSEVERGMTGLSLKHLVKLSEIFSVSLDYLIKGTEFTSKDAPDITVLIETFQTSSSYTQQQMLRLIKIVQEIEKHASWETD